MSYLEARRDRVAQAWALTDEIVLVPAGDPIALPGTDQFYLFRARPDHRYLADSNEPARVIAYDARDQSWTMFSPRVSVEDRVWHAAADPVGRDIAELAAFLEGRTTHVLHEDSGLTTAVAIARRIKDDEELARLRKAATATAGGFAEARRAVVAGATELEVEAELEVGFLRAGGDFPAFESIVAAASNAAVLHAMPTTTTIQQGNFVLIDAGAAADGYSCDCTRTIVCGGEASDDQRAIHAIVLAAQREAVAACRPGAEYVDIHMAAARSMAAGLVDMGVLMGNPAELVQSGAASLFFPHGVGHLIGLCTHDPAGYAGGRERSEHLALQALRADLPLESGMVVTIEPGMYFIEALLNDPERRAMHENEVNWARAESLCPLGGVRIEDSVHITDGAPEVLTVEIPHNV
jgi:Xaa-Pro aminopeptidase